MKKWISALLALCLACMMLPAPAEEVSPVGTWYLVRGEKDGAFFHSSGDMSMVMTLNEDGTCSIQNNMYGIELEYTGTWESADGAVTVTDNEGTPMKLSFAGEELTLDMEGTRMYFSRTAPKEPNGSVAERIPAEAAEQFNGTWKISRVLMMGTVTSAENAGMEQVAGMEILDGHITEIGWVDGEPVKAETDCEFRDGFLVTTRNVYGVPIGITYALLEDGTLSCVMELDGVEMTIIYEKADAAAEEPAA